MTVKTLSKEPVPLDAPENASRTSDYAISVRAREALVSALERADDMVIAREIQVRDLRRGDDRMELDDFIREQGYDPADLAS